MPAGINSPDTAFFRKLLHFSEEKSIIYATINEGIFNERLKNITQDERRSPMESYEMNIGNNIREIRNLRRYSQERLAKLTGISESTVKRLKKEFEL